MENMDILQEAAVVIGVLVVSYLILLGLFIALFRIFFPFKKEDPHEGARKIVAKISRNIRKEGKPRKIKLANG